MSSESRERAFRRRVRLISSFGGGRGRLRGSTGFAKSRLIGDLRVSGSPVIVRRSANSVEKESCASSEEFG